MKVRANFYLSKDRLDALKVIAREEDTNVSDLVREAIDAILKKRLERPRSMQDSIGVKIQQFLETYAGTGTPIDDIDAVIDRINPRGRPIQSAGKSGSR
jgi:hypothetical protein